MPHNAQGTKVRYGGPAGTCMVIGCSGRAIYRNARSAVTNHTEHGYCAIHKALAIAVENARYVDGLAAFIEDSEARERDR